MNPIRIELSGRPQRECDIGDDLASQAHAFPIGKGMFAPSSIDEQEIAQWMGEKPKMTLHSGGRTKLTRDGIDQLSVGSGGPLWRSSGLVDDQQNQDRSATIAREAPETLEEILPLAEGGYAESVLIRATREQRPHRNGRFGLRMAFEILLHRLVLNPGGGTQCNAARITSPSTIRASAIDNSLSLETIRSCGK